MSELRQLSVREWQIWFSVLGYVPASEALHVLIQVDAGNTVTYLRPLHQRGPTTGPPATWRADIIFMARELSHY